jgi:hypothetical protein
MVEENKKKRLPRKLAITFKEVEDGLRMEKILYDHPSVLSYEKYSYDLFKIYFSVEHDDTDFNLEEFRKEIGDKYELTDVSILRI